MQNFFHANLYQILTQIFLIFCTTTPALYNYSVNVVRVWFISCEDSSDTVMAVCVNICVLTDNSNRTCGQLRDGCLCQYLCTDRQQQQNLWTAAIGTKIFRAFRLKTGTLL